jgi:hypothetical protein
MLEDGDRILKLVGVALVLAVVIALGVIAVNFDRPADEPEPDGNWSVERVDNSRVEVTRTDGEPVTPGEVVVTVDGVRRNAEWTDPIVPGSSVTVDASEGSLVRVVWAGGRGERERLHEQRL